MIHSKSIRMSIRMNAEDLRLLQIVCERSNRTVSSVIRSQIDELIAPLRATVIKNAAQPRDGPLEEPVSALVESNEAKKGEPECTV